MLHAKTHIHFNNFLKFGVLIAVALITIGGVIYLVHNGMESYHIETDTPKLATHTVWLVFVKMGIFLLIILQIIRVLFFAVMFYIDNKIMLASMGLFITLVLTGSLVLEQFK